MCNIEFMTSVKCTEQRNVHTVTATQTCLWVCHTPYTLFILNCKPLFHTCFYSDPDDPYKLTEDTRDIGLVVCRGTSVVLICPADGMEQIANPFVQQEG